MVNIAGVWQRGDIDRAGTVIGHGRSGVMCLNLNWLSPELLGQVHFWSTFMI